MRMSPLRKIKAREKFTIRHQYLRCSLNNRSQERKSLAIREIRGKEVNSIVKNKGRESFKMGESDATKSSYKARMKENCPRIWQSNGGILVNINSWGIRSKCVTLMINHVLQSKDHPKSKSLPSRCYPNSLISFSSFPSSKALSVRMLHFRKDEVGRAVLTPICLAPNVLFPPRISQF